MRNLIICYPTSLLEMIEIILKPCYFHDYHRSKLSLELHLENFGIIGFPLFSLYSNGHSGYHWMSLRY